MVYNLSESNSVFNHFIAEIRDVDIQRDSMRFRRNMERIGEVLGYELSKTLTYDSAEVTTPLGVAETNLISHQPVIASILRAGLPMHQGVLNIFDKAENSFISAYRKHHKDGDFEVHVEYMASPSIEGKTVIIVDPMIATGSSMVLVYKSLLQMGTPKKVIIMSAIASKEAVEYVMSKLPRNSDLWVGAIDAELTAQSYVVPGLGDAGDLSYGKKN
jgi:uracil phosphoribosyltransferase